MKFEAVFQAGCRDVRRAIQVLLARQVRSVGDRRGLAVHFDADDIESSVWLRAWKQRQQLLGAARPVGWVCNLVRWEVLRRLSDWRGGRQWRSIKPNGTVSMGCRVGHRDRCAFKFSEVLDAEGRDLFYWV